MFIIDVSNTRRLLDLDSSHHFNAEYDQFYRPCGKWGFEQDGADIVYAWASSIQTSAAYPILMREWMYLVAPGGCLVMDYSASGKPDSIKIEDELWIQWAGYYEIIEHRIIENDLETSSKSLVASISESIRNYSSMEDVGFDAYENQEKIGFRRIVVRKTKSSKFINDDMGKWSFGIVTNGKRNEWLSELIDSIGILGIPEHEIIVCGHSDQNFSEKSKVRYIPFNKRTSEGWLCKKKNLIIQSAMYENIIIVHDRYVFEKTWFKGMQNWGNNFEFMTCAQEFKNTEGTDSTEVLWLNGFDHIKLNLLRKKRSFVMYLLSWKVFMKSSYPSWGLIIAKKSWYDKIWGFDENLFWQEWEDVHLAKKFVKNWMYCRFNQMALCRIQNYIRPTRTPFWILDNIWIETESTGNGRIRKKRNIRNLIRYAIMSIMEKSLTNKPLNVWIEWLKHVVKILKRTN